MSAMETEVIIKVEGTELTLMRVNKYDLVLYNFLVEDHATYFCKVVQGDQVIMLAAWTVQVRQGLSAFSTSLFFRIRELPIRR